MAAFPKWKTVQAIARARACIVGLVVASTAFAATDVESLQDLGSQVRRAADRARTGFPVDRQQVARFKHALKAFRSVSPSNDRSLLATKHDAIARLVDRLELSTRAPVVARASPTRVDQQIVSDRHGGTCQTAMGLSSTARVAVALARPGQGRSDAWFRFQIQDGDSHWFRASSSEADPAIEIFQGCSSAPIASNDDAFGLNASVSIASAHAAVMFVHLTNSGASGTVSIEVETTSGTISGRVTDSATGSPLVGLEISANGADVSGSQYFGYTGPDGTYEIPVPSGNYYVEGGDYSYVTQLYPNVACRAGTYYFNLYGCPTASATAVAVADGGVVNGIDFALDHGFQLLGTVRSTTNQPLIGTTQLYDEAGDSLISVQTDSVGHYLFQTLPSAQYKVSAKADGYGSQMYDGVACGGPLQNTCNYGQATTVTVDRQDVLGVDFSLPQLASIHGTITNAALQPLAGQTQVSVIDANGGLVAQSYTSDSYGHYVAGPLGPGTYSIFVDSPGYFSQLFDGVDCGLNCAFDLSGATAVEIAEPGQQVAADFRLNPLPIVRGHVQDAISGLPLAGVHVIAGTNPPAMTLYLAATATTDTNGDYAFESIPPGKYYVWAISPDHVDEIYPSLPCELPGGVPSYFIYAVCDVTGAAFLTVAPGVFPPHFDFALPASAAIKGHAWIRAGAGSDLPAPVIIEVFNGSGQNVAGSSIDALGNYIIGDLAPGTYFVSASGFGNAFLEQVWQQIDCPAQCAPTAGTPIPLVPGATASDVDFSVVQRNAVVGRITDGDGDPLAGVIVDLFNSADATYRSSGVSNASGYYSATGDFGFAYFVATEAGGAYVDQVYIGLQCPGGPAYYGLCPFAGAVSVTLNSVSTQPRIVDFVLKSRDPIFANGFESQ